MADSDLVVVRTYGNRAEAEVAVTALHAAEIVAVLRPDDAGGMRPGLAGISLVVRADEADRAREVLDTPAIRSN